MSSGPFEKLPPAGAASSSPSGFELFARRFAILIRQVESVDVRVPEDSALIGLAADLVPKVTRQLREGVELLEAVESYYDPSRYEPPARGPEVDTLLHIGQLISSEFAARDLSDLVFFARTELKTALDKMLESATRDASQLTLASNCENSLRCLRKALVSVESAFYEFEGVKAPPRQWFDVELSLQIRKLYWNLRRETELAGRGGQSLEEKLRKVLYRVVAFRELSVYPFLRVDDRVHLRQLLKRILDWLNGESRDGTEGKRIWEDLTGFAEILVQVSHRQELQDHDRELLEQVHRQLFRRHGQQRMPPALWSKLDNVLGLDEELDVLIGTRQESLDPWRTPLEKVIDRLSARPSADLWESG
jgi:hypothetical protein